MNMNYPIGSVSSGTMREEDLIPSFMDELESLSKKQYAELRRDHKEELAILEKDSDEWTNDDLESLSYFLNEILFEKLSEFAPPYFYFGSHPGDGSDYGFWFSEEAFEQAVQDGEVIKCAQLPNRTERKLDDCEYYAVVSDHGNVTLYDRAGKEVWS